MSDIEHWTIKGHDSGPVQWITGSMLVVGGRPLGAGERIEVVPASELAGAVASIEAIITHARLDRDERGIAEAERYIGLAQDALDRLGGQ